jgi:hypothetical protein
MRFEPKTEKEIIESYLLPDGVYDFVVVKATDSVTQKGEECLNLQLKVFDKDGSARTVFDTFYSNNELKIRHFAYAVGLGPLYETGIIESFNCQDKQGQVKLKKGIAKDGTPKMFVMDYVIEEKELRIENSQPPFHDDDIPNFN